VGGLILIKSIQIKNILSHIDTSLEFDPGVNMVIGHSDHGKSVIMWAFNWCFYNRPTGESLRNWDGGIMSVKTAFTEGDTLTLTKDKQGVYTVKNKGQEAKTFHTFGVNPPDEIPSLLNLNQRINIQTQFEPIFLISESPGEVAKFFNEIAGLELINKTITKGKSDLLKTENEHKNIKSQIKDKKTELSLYDGIEELEEKVIKALRIQDKIKMDKSTIEDIQYALTDIEEIQNNIQGLKQKNKIRGKVIKAEKLLKNIEIDSSEIFSIETDIEKIKDIQEQINTSQSKSNILPKVDRALVLYQVIKSKVIKSRKNEINVLTGNKNDIESLFKYNKSIEKVINELNREFKKLMPVTCPLCGRS